MTTTTCEFSNPVNLNSETKPDWEYQALTCYSESDNPNGQLYNLIQNSTTGAEFYVQKTLTYGEGMILWFLTMFAFYLIFKTAYNFFWKK